MRLQSTPTNEVGKMLFSMLSRVANRVSWFACGVAAGVTAGATYNVLGHSFWGYEHLVNSKDVQIQKSDRDKHKDQAEHHFSLAVQNFNCKTHSLGSSMFPKTQRFFSVFSTAAAIASRSALALEFDQKHEKGVGELKEIRKQYDDAYWFQTAFFRWPLQSSNQMMNMYLNACKTLQHRMIARVGGMTSSHQAACSEINDYYKARIDESSGPKASHMIHYTSAKIALCASRHLFCDDNESLSSADQKLIGAAFSEAAVRLYTEAEFKPVTKHNEFDADLQEFMKHVGNTSNLCFKKDNIPIIIQNLLGSVICVGNGLIIQDKSVRLDTLKWWYDSHMDHVDTSKPLTSKQALEFIRFPAYAAVVSGYSDLVVAQSYIDECEAMKKCIEPADNSKVTANYYEAKARLAYRKEQFSQALKDVNECIEHGASGNDRDAFRRHKLRFDISSHLQCSDMENALHELRTSATVLDSTGHMTSKVVSSTKALFDTKCQLVKQKRGSWWC